MSNEVLRHSSVGATAAPAVHSYALAYFQDLYANAHKRGLYSMAYIRFILHNVYSEKNGVLAMEQIARTSKQIGAAIRRRRRAGLSQTELGAKHL